MPNRRFLAQAVILLAAALHAPHAAWAAGGAYQVDTSDVTPGGCKVESWVSWAANRDFLAATTPSCAIDVGAPLELSAQFSRARADGDWATGVTPKAKLNFVPSGIGTFGYALTLASSFDLTAGEHTGIALAIPATMRLTENTRINLNLGWLWDRNAARHYATYGVGFDWRTPDNVWTLTAEVFGLLGDDTGGVVHPRAQAGLRWRPIDRFSIDVIYGRNLGGEDSNWITVATILRFPPPEK